MPKGTLCDAGEGFPGQELLAIGGLLDSGKVLGEDAERTSSVSVLHVDELVEVEICGPSLSTNGGSSVVCCLQSTDLWSEERHRLQT